MVFNLNYLEFLFSITVPVYIVRDLAFAVAFAVIVIVVVVGFNFHQQHRIQIPVVG